MIKKMLMNYKYKVIDKKMILLEKSEVEFFSEKFSGNLLFGRTDLNTLTQWYTNELDHLSNSIDELEERMKLTHSCKIGCSHCCNQAIYIDPFEYDFLKIELRKMSKDKRYEIKEKANKICKSVQNIGIPMKFFRVISTSEQNEYNESYFKHNLTCPLLEDEKCLIYSVRPLVCASFRNYGSELDCKYNHAPVFGYPYMSASAEITIKMTEHYEPKTKLYRLLPYALYEIL